MSRRNWSRLTRLEEVIESHKPPASGMVLFPGQEPHEGFTGPVVRIQIVDGRRPVTS